MPIRLALLASVLTLAGCAASPEETPAATSAPLSLDVTADGQPVRLAVGQRVTVTLDANPTTGF